MTSNSESRNTQDQRKSVYFLYGRWVSLVAQSVSAAIAIAVAAAVTVVVTVLVLLGGLWIAYSYLPANIFYIILAVLIADIALGIILRHWLAHR